MTTTSPASMGGPLSEAERGRNQHCMNCGDTRGGPVGHETSECTYDSAAGAVRAALRPGFKLTLSRLILASQQDTYPLADADDSGGPYIVDGCVVYGAQQLTDALRTVWKYTPALLDELEAARARVGVLEGQLATARALHVRERRYTDGDSEGSWGVADECAADLGIPIEAVQHFDICKHCGDMETHDDELREYRDSLWPCPDARALGLDGGGSGE